LITTFCKQINSLEDVYFENLNEDQTGLNTPCESKVVAHDDHDAGFSPKEFEENVRKHLSLEFIICRFLFVFFIYLSLALINVDDKDEVRSPIPNHSCFQRFKRNTRNGKSTYIEKFVYSRRKSAVKRKLQFDANGDGSMKNIKKFKCDDSEDM
jgi:hypothetical protein